MKDDLSRFDDPGYEDDEDTSVVKGAWTIQNAGSLEWAMKRLANLKAEQEEIVAAANEAKRRIDARRDALLDRAGRGVAFFTAQIEKYATENRDAVLGGGAKKSREFLHGRLGWRKRTGRLVVVDAEELGKWLRSQDDITLYRVKIEPEMKALQEQFKIHGVIPPGMEYEADKETFYVEPTDPSRVLKG